MCFRMIEGPHTGPAILAVAALAPIAEPSFMRIGLPVAVDAAVRRAAELHFGQMTTVASRVLVAAVELKIRESVIERLPVELNDVGSPAFVIGMALLALRFRSIVTLSMQAASKLPVLGDVLVAGKAEARLRGFRESFMAVRAVVFELCVAFDERTRHDELLEYVLSRGGEDPGAQDDQGDRQEPEKR